jgi:hypothetical protein
MALRGLFTAPAPPPASRPDLRLSPITITETFSAPKGVNGEVMSRTQENLEPRYRGQVLRAMTLLAEAQSRLSSGDHDADEMLRIAAEAIDDAVSSLEAALS